MQASAAGLQAGSVIRFWTRLPRSATTVTKVCLGSVTPGPLPREVLRKRRQFMDLYLQSMGQLVVTGFQARSKDQEILEEGGGAGPSLLPRRDHE